MLNCLLRGDFWLLNANCGIKLFRISMVCPHQAIGRSPSFVITVEGNRGIGLRQSAACGAFFLEIAFCSKIQDHNAVFYLSIVGDSARRKVFIITGTGRRCCSNPDQKDPDGG